MENEKVQENLFRRKAKRLGLRLVKSRVRSININDHGGYMMVDNQNNFVVAGSKFDMDLEDVNNWLNEYENNLIEERKRSK